jgi:hypothetical protein
MSFLPFSFLEQTPMLVVLSTGFVFIFFFLFNFFFLNGGVKQGSLFMNVVSSLLRSCILVIFLLGIFEVPLFLNSKSQKEKIILLIVDHSISMKNSDEKQLKLAFENLVGIIQEKHPNTELKILTHTGKFVDQTEVIFNNGTSNFQILPKKIFLDLKPYSITQIYIFSDFQIENEQFLFQTKFATILIPYGNKRENNKVSISVPKRKIISVPNESIHIPVTIEGSSEFKELAGFVSLFLDGKFYAKKVFQLKRNQFFQEIDFEVSQTKLGNHTLSFKLNNEDLNNYQKVNWEIVKQKALAIGYAPAPHPDLGVLNRIAKEMNIKLDWSFKAPDCTKKNRIIWNEKQIKIFGVSGENIFTNINLWRNQIKEKMLLGNSFHLDSTIKSWYYQSFFSGDLDTNFRVSENLKNANISNKLDESITGRNLSKIQQFSLNPNIEVIELNDLRNWPLKRKGRLENDSSQSEMLNWLDSSYFYGLLIVLILLEWGIRKKMSLI